MTGRVGVCAATFGPGTSNPLTGLLEAHRSSVPMIALVQDHALKLKDRHASSALDHATALRPFVKAVIRIDYPEQAADLTRRAFRLATTGRPGPIGLICPADVMASETEGDPQADPAYTHIAQPTGPAPAPRLSRGRLNCSPEPNAHLLSLEVARALKRGGESVVNPDDLAAAIQRGLGYNGPYLINAEVDPEAAAPIVGFDKPVPAGASH